MAEQSAGEKTLPASPQKILRARQEGNVPKSQDLSAGVMLLIALIGLWIFGPTAMENMIQSLRFYFADADVMLIEKWTAQTALAQAVLLMARILVPFLLLLFAGGILVNVMQIGFLASPKVIAPKLQRINPLSGFQKFFSLRSLVELVKSLFKLSMVGYIVYLTLRGRSGDILSLMHLSPRAATTAVGGLLFTIWWRIATALIIIGILDYAFQRWQYLRDLRMTQQEAKQELKQLEGDPAIKQRIRQIQRQVAMQRMMADVPTADVIITNPTAYAIALRYDEETMTAPFVVAKGARLIAERIRDIATLHQVPIIEKKELAQTLYKTVDIGHQVPEAVFRTIAEVLAYVYQIDRRTEKIQQRTQFRTAQQAV